MAYFWSIFPNFWSKNIFLGNPALPRTTSYGFLGTCQNSEKNWWCNSKKMSGQKDGGKDGRTEGSTDPILLYPSDYRLVSKNIWISINNHVVEISIFSTRSTWIPSIFISKMVILLCLKNMHLLYSNQNPTYSCSINFLLKVSRFIWIFSIDLTLAFEWILVFIFFSKLGLLFYVELFFNSMKE